VDDQRDFRMRGWRVTGIKVLDREWFSMEAMCPQDSLCWADAGLTSVSTYLRPSSSGAPVKPSRTNTVTDSAPRVSASLRAKVLRDSNSFKGVEWCFSRGVGEENMD